MATLRYINLKTLDTFDQMKVKTISGKCAKKLERDMPGLSLVLRCKQYNKEGKRAKYVFDAKTLRPTVIAVKASDWDLATAVHKAMQKLEHSVQKRFHTEGQKQGKVHVKESKRRKKR